MENGADLISKERKEQLEIHRRSISRDISENNSEQLKLGAIAILEGDYSKLPPDWQWSLGEKMCLKPYKERLIIAGALIAAEIDRIQNQK